MTRIASLVLVVRDLARAITIWEGCLGFARVDEASEVPSLGARHIVLRGGNCLLELVEPYDEEKPPGQFLRARGEGMFAMALEVEDPERARAQLASAFVDARGAEPESRHWFLRPTDAHGMLVEVGGPDAG
jgi:catechol 2,3-dioxygenase-like lactoylglutathione lyase family enzyme